MERTIRYGLIDLANRTTQRVTLQAARFGTWGMLGEELAFWWQQDREAVALTTGPLTGCGAPGTGAMAWSYLKEGRLHTLATEGRLGAWLRYAGLDALVFCGKTDGPLWLEVSAQGQALRSGKPSYAALAAQKPTEEAVVATVRPRGILEDGLFALSDRSLARRLLDKGLTALVVDAGEEGGLAVADSARLARLCVELYSWAAKEGPLAGDRNAPARYLSLDHMAPLNKRDIYMNPACTPEEQLYAALGILWSPHLEGRDRRADTAALLEACLGGRCDPAELDQLGNYLARLRLTNLEGGEA